MGLLTAKERLSWNGLDAVVCRSSSGDVTSDMSIFLLPCSIYLNQFLTTQGNVHFNSCEPSRLVQNMMYFYSDLISSWSSNSASCYCGHSKTDCLRRTEAVQVRSEVTVAKRKTVRPVSATATTTALSTTSMAMGKEFGNRPTGSPRFIAIQDLAAERSVCHHELAWVSKHQKLL